MFGGTVDKVVAFQVVISVIILFYIMCLVMVMGNHVLIPITSYTSRNLGYRLAVEAAGKPSIL